MNRIVLITGYPCCYKTTTGRELRKKGWLHIDAESPVKTIAHQLLSDDLSGSFSELAKLHDRVVVTWGMPVRMLRRWIKPLQDIGVECWFFKRPLEDCGADWQAREGRLPEGPEEEQFKALYNLSQNALGMMFNGNYLDVTDRTAEEFISTLGD